MSMLGMGDKARQRVPGGVDTLLGASVTVRGDLKFAGGLYVDGLVTGKVHAENDQPATLTVSEQGRIEGEVRAPVVVINGEVRGEVFASERLVLGPKARVHGNLHYTVVEMAAGATVDGRMSHLDAQARPAEKPLSAVA